MPEDLLRILGNLRMSTPFRRELLIRSGWSVEKMPAVGPSDLPGEWKERPATNRFIR